MTTPNYKAGIGNLVTDRFDFQKHINGTSFRHTADQIDYNADGYTTVYNALHAIITGFTPPVIADASTSTKGIVKLSGDIGGTATSVSVLALRGYPISNIAPTTNYVLTWDGSIWKPAAIADGYVRTISNNLVIDTGVKDNIILVDTTSSAINLTLPSPTSGRTITIKDKIGNASANPISLLQHGAEYIDGVAATRVLATDWGCWRVISDGSNWYLC